MASITVSGYSAYDPMIRANAQLSQLTPTGPTNQTATSGGTPTVDPMLLHSSVSDILDLNAKQTELEASQAGTQAGIIGAQQESLAYANASALALQNFDIEGVTENIREVQQVRDTMKAAGTQSSAIAANGFTGGSGSGADIMAQTMAQGTITNQLSRFASNNTQIGFAAQSIAADQEKVAADAKVSAGEELLSAQQSSASSIAAQSASLTNALSSTLSGDDAANQLVNDLTSGNVDALGADLLTYNPSSTENQAATGTSSWTTSPTSTNYVVANTSTSKPPKGYTTDPISDFPIPVAQPLSTVNPNSVN